MSSIHLETFIAAPIERVFDLSRSIDFHKWSVKHTHEEAIEGRTTGLIGLNETVTWRAKHLGVFQTLRVKITDYQYPYSFTDEMIKGAFKKMKHKHLFEEHQNGTIMTCDFSFESPFGLIGELVNYCFLEQYMKGFLLLRNKKLKEAAESDLWKEILNKQNE